MLHAASESDWTNQLGCFLPAIAAASESREGYSVIKAIRLVCKAWLSSVNSARRLWRPQYRCTTDGVKALARACTNLTHVDLSACHPHKPVDLEPLLQLKSLKSFHAGNFAICVPSGSSEALASLTNLVQLNLCPLGDLTLFKLSSLQQLTQLAIRGPEVYTSPGGQDCYENETAAHHVLQQLSCLAQLQSLALSRLALSEAAWEALAHMTQLQKLCIAEVIHTAYVRRMARKPEEHVNSLASEAAFEAVCRLTNLTELDMPESLVYMTSIQGVSCLSTLTKLDIQGIESIRSLDGLEQVSSLEWVDMSGLTSVSTLAPLQHLTNLRVLRFARCINVQTWGVQAISLLRKLEVLDMHCCAFSSTWITLLTGLTKLCCLDMSVGNWRDQDIVQLTACKQLTYLGLKDCPSTTASMHTILRERLPLLIKLEAACSTSGDQYAGFLGWPY